MCLCGPPLPRPCRRWAAVTDQTTLILNCPLPKEMLNIDRTAHDFNHVTAPFTLNENVLYYCHSKNTPPADCQQSPNDAASLLDYPASHAFITGQSVLVLPLQAQSRLVLGDG